MTSIWKVDSSTSVYPDSSSGDHTSLTTVIIQDKLGAFLCSQLGFSRSFSPAYMSLPSPGVDIPFINFQSPSFNHRIRASNYSIALQGNRTFGSPIELLTSTPDDTPRFIASSGAPNENAIVNFQKRERWKWALSNEKNSFSMFPAIIPATSFSMISCDLLSEIQRHMLEPVIDGGLTWSPLWTKEEVQGYLNERLDNFYLRTGVIQEQFSVPITSGFSEYNYPFDLIEAKRLSFEEDSSLFSGLKHFWSMNEGSGTRMDSIGTNNLTETNGSVTSFPGKIGNSAQFFRPVQGILGVSSTVAPDINGDFTYGGWFYVDSKTVSSRIIYEGFRIDLLLTSTNLVAQFVNLISGTSGVAATFGKFIPLNTWQFVVVWYNDTTHEIGIQLNEHSNTFFATFGASPPNATLTFGGSGLTNPFAGRTDMWFIYNRVLTKSERDLLWNNGNGMELTPTSFIPGTFHSLTRQDPFSQDNGRPGWQNETGIPEVIIEEPRSPLSFQLSPIPNVNGSVKGIYVADPLTIGDVCVPLPIPNFLCWGIKYGVMADMLNKEGEANDPERAKYCEARFDECVQLTRALLGFNDPEEKGQ